MSKYDMLIRSNNAYIDNNLIACDIGIKNGKIVSIDRISNSNLKNGDVFIKADEKIVLPGTIDPHVHINQPNNKKVNLSDESIMETFESGTIAAASGGITTIIEHPISTPPAYSPALVSRKMEIAAKQIVVDTAFFGAAGSEHLEEIAPCSKSGIVAFKTFLHDAPKGREEEFVSLTAPTDGDLYKVMLEIAKTKTIASFHAENDSIISTLVEQYKKEGNISPIFHAKSRPSLTETEAVIKILHLAEKIDLCVQIVHISTPEAALLVDNAKKKGLCAVAETCPHYLFLNEEDLIKYGGYAKCNPPLRTEKERQKMWTLIQNGVIDIISSDHSGDHTLQKKENEDIFAISAGFPSIEERLPLLFTEVKNNKLSLNKMVELICINPAKVYGLFPKKGIITIGADADLIIIDPDKRQTISRKRMFTRNKDMAVIYEGREVFGKPDTTIVRGKIVFDNGEIKVKPGYGNILKK